MYCPNQVTLFATFAAASLAQCAVAPVAPKMTFLYSMDALLGPSFSLGPIPTGQNRVVIPIIGGNFTGPRMNGTVLNLGADWLLVDSRGVSLPDTRYNIRTSDGTNIYVRTEGTPGQGGRIMLKGKFETAVNGTYSWLNDVLAVGVLNVQEGGVGINMWVAEPGDVI